MGGDRRGPPRRAVPGGGASKPPGGTVLLQRFHDILPGSSIAWVHQEAERKHAARRRRRPQAPDRRLAPVARGEAAPTRRRERRPVRRRRGGRRSRGRPAPARRHAAARRAARLRPGGRPPARRRRRARGCSSRSSTAPPAGRACPRAPRRGAPLLRDTPREWDAWDINAEDQRTTPGLLEPRAAPRSASDGDAVVRPAPVRRLLHRQVGAPRVGRRPRSSAPSTSTGTSRRSC